MAKFEFGNFTNSFATQNCKKSVCRNVESRKWLEVKAQNARIRFKMWKKRTYSISMVKSKPNTGYEGELCQCMRVRRSETICAVYRKDISPKLLLRISVIKTEKWVWINWKEIWNAEMVKTKFAECHSLIK